ncbi:hypothetical protein QYF36_004164 [Acer negundo]|nr:hypothetical protein QYF36_004164 [Acer negundo]
MGCCCSGGYGRCYVDAKVKEENEEYQEHLFTLCRDAHSKHVIRTMAYEAPHHFPFPIALYRRDAIEYIGKLQHELKKLNEELQEIEEEECNENAELKSSKLDGLHE